MTEKTSRRTRYPGSWRKKVALLRDLQELHVASTLQQVLDALTQLLRREFQASHVLFCLWDGRREEFFYQNPEWLRGRRTTSGTGFAAQAIETKTSLLARSPDLALDPHLEAAFRAPIRTALAAPLVRNQTVLGAVELINRSDGGKFTASDQEYLEALSHHLAITLNNFLLTEEAERKKKEERQLREIARSLNSAFDLDSILEEILLRVRFLPARMPTIRDMGMAARNVPSRLVSGDVYDLIPIVAGQWGIMIGDVTGKGISAGLIMAAYRAALLAEIRNNFSIGAILRKVNRLLWETTDPSHFVTSFYGVYDEDRRVLTYSNAGHNPPLLLRADDRTEWLSEGGTILGGFRDSDYQKQLVVLEPGDWLVLYTDGLTEARLPDGEELGERRLEELVRAHRTLSPEGLASRLAEEVLRYSAGARPEDDATLLVIHVER